MVKVLNPMPYFKQGDNLNNPGGTCNVTSLAMALAALGIVGDGNGQLEDQLFREAARRGLDYHEADTLRILAEWKMRKDTFKRAATWAEIRAHLQKGLPVILHTFLTPSGHIVAVRGFDDSAYAGQGAFICNDPAGEWHGGGYGERPNGNAVPYSYFLLDCACRATDRGGYYEAMGAYQSGHRLPSSQTILWAHLLSR